jgi:branched-chain amino acid transport system ATP-binding protein
MALKIESISKHYGGVYAVREVSLECGHGEILGLIGPNGAGKTTLMNLITGVSPSDGGTVTLDEKNLSGLSARKCAYAGVARTFQNIRLFEHLSVRENIEVAYTTSEFHRAEQVGRVTIERLLDQMDLLDMADRPAPTLPYGYQRRLEIARALALAPDYLLLDEPAAGMNRIESTELIESIKFIRDEYGCGIIVIDHDLRFIMTVCERIAVLHMGELIALGTPEDVRNDPRVIEVYIGTQDKDGASTTSTPQASPSDGQATMDQPNQGT